MAKLLAIFDYDFQAFAVDREEYAADPTVQVTAGLGRRDYTITFEDFEPRSGAVTTEGDSFNLVDLLDSASLREYRVIL